MLRLRPLERIRAPSPETFRRRYQDASQPVVLTGALDDWPARDRWTPAYFAHHFGDRRVPAAEIAGNTLKHDPKSGIPYVDIPLGPYVAALEADEPPTRYVTFAVEDHLTELADDLRAFPYASGALWSRRRIWLAPRGSASPIHQDLPDNLYAQFVGRKRFYLFPKDESRRMYRFAPWSSLPNFGRVDAENPDFDRFPAFAKATGWVVTLEPGDVLFLPSRWWHQTRALETSLAVNLWWSSRRALAAALHAAEAYKRARGLSL